MSHYPFTYSNLLFTLCISSWLWELTFAAVAGAPVLIRQVRLGRLRRVDCQPQRRNANAQIECLAARTKPTLTLRTFCESFTTNFSIICRRIFLEEICSMNGSFILLDVYSTSTEITSYPTAPWGIRTESPFSCCVCT